MATTDPTTYNVATFNSTSGSTGSWNVIPSSTTISGFPQVPQCPTGHQADPNYAEYLDGEIATTCAVCGQRITFQHLPGGVPLLRLKALVEQVMAGTRDGRVLEDFAAVSEALEAERQVLAAADALLAVARALLEK